MNNFVDSVIVIRHIIYILQFTTQMIPIITLNSGQTSIARFSIKDTSLAIHENAS